MVKSKSERAAEFSRDLMAQAAAEAVDFLEQLQAPAPLSRLAVVVSRELPYGTPRTVERYLEAQAVQFQRVTGKRSAPFEIRTVQGQAWIWLRGKLIGDKQMQSIWEDAIPR